MIVASYVNLKPEVAHSRTYEDFYKFLGANPKYMGVMARMNQSNTATFLTEGLMNIYYNEKTVNKYQPINSLMVEWDIDVEFIERIPFSAVPSGNGAGSTEITMLFPRRYYEQYETFIIENSHQQCMVMNVPVRKADNLWEYVVKLVDSDYSATLDLNACQPGMKTRWLSNVQPEYHDNGYLKYVSNVERHRTWITEHRVDGEMSARYEALEDQFIKIAEGETSGTPKEKIFKLSPLEKDVYENFKVAKNNALLWQKTTMDPNGKAMLYTADNRPLIAGDGLIPQYERFAGKLLYTGAFGVPDIQLVMKQMAEKSNEQTGNNWVFVVNNILWNDINVGLAEWLKGWGSVPTILYSKAVGKDLKVENPIKVGGTFVSYEINGNVINFIVDKSLTREYPDKGFGICMDLTPDMSKNQPAIAAFTLKGKEFTVNNLDGVGIKSGSVATPAAAKKFMVSGYSGIAAFAPYRSFIVRQN